MSSSGSDGLRYAAVRGDSPGPLFKLPSGVPMTRAYFVGKVREVLPDLGLSEQNYAGHTFQVGAAMTAAMVGIDFHISLANVPALPFSSFLLWLPA